MAKLRSFGRIKEKVSRPPNKDERLHFARLVTMGCLICGGPAEIHHVHSDGMKRIGKSHKRVVPLCPGHHRTGLHAVHRISHAVFCVMFDIDLLAEADRLWAEKNLRAPVYQENSPYAGAV